MKKVIWMILPFFSYMALPILQDTFYFFSLADKIKLSNQPHYWLTDFLDQYLARFGLWKPPTSTLSSWFHLTTDLPIIGHLPATTTFLPFSYFLFSWVLYFQLFFISQSCFVTLWLFIWVISKPVEDFQYNSTRSTTTELSEKGNKIYFKMKRKKIGLVFNGSSWIKATSPRFPGTVSYVSIFFITIYLNMKQFPIYSNCLFSFS